MPEKDPLVGSFVHLDRFPRAKEALHTLQKIASLVKPIMRARNWKVRELAEFYPDQHNLLGLNVDRGRRICIRLRYPGDKTQFMPMENVVDTMLHELAHIVHGPHNGHFHALWNQLRDEHQGLLMKGYTGEGFLSEGRRLGGGGASRMPKHEARRLARDAAEKRRRGPSGTGPGQRLGGSAARPGSDLRKTIADAAEGRNKTLRGCASDKLTDSQIRELADTATRNGFRTQAEEDEANEAAIAQAMWELVQEDKHTEYGSSYVTPSQENPSGSREAAEAAVHIGTSELRASTAHDRWHGQGKTQTQSQTHSGGGRGSGSGEDRAIRSLMWTCATCTLENAPNYLCCDACGSERTPEASRKLWQNSWVTPPPKTGSETIDLTGDSPQSKRTQEAPRPPRPPIPDFWQCSWCGKMMEKQWWTCSTCGRMKERS